MKAVICTKYGSPEVLQIQGAQKPKCGSHELLTKVMATAVNSADVKVRGLAVKGILKPLMRVVLGFKKPRNPILGTIYSGVVEEIGESVTRFKPGDKVFGSTGFHFGTYAEYLSTKENSPVHLMPKNASFEEAAALIFGGQTAHYFLEKARLSKRSRPKVLIIGSTGSVGIAAIQIALYYKAEVTAVCGSSSKALMTALRVENTIFYDQDDFRKQSNCYDILFDAVGCTKLKFCRHLLKPEGKFVSVDGLSYATETTAQLEFIKTVFEKGEMKAIIDKTYSLEAIQQAHAYVDTGRKKGNIVIRVSE
ncbi:NAD(P)-dependent alcohol dehydrogenase [Arenibacter sp. GZD96]|uniref:NAD(P)-dependent alcohol dehydrogenase n=1 Tax=Aurantibrevibacter litoralis TaxID=3106030 RepID=UPI002AFEBBB2|nr:NAD(P)-dependent alcohol dehydrogenase [Arenibacter sp. GZD-96]MEA1784755.1 NAD(P)-dependent alcohol dehydrogenase [Arenibacter sp. GZD-96]